MSRTQRIPTENIGEFCRRWKITEMTADRAAANFDENIGIFLRFDPQAEWNLTDRMRMMGELRIMSGNSVHVESPKNFKRSNEARHVLYDA